MTRRLQLALGLQASGGVAGAGGGFQATTLATGSAARGTISGGNLTFVKEDGASICGARSLSFQDTGLFFFEVTVGTSAGADDGAGIMIADNSYQQATANGVNGAYCFFNTGNLYGSAGNSGKSLGAVADGAILDYAYNMTSRKMWVRKAAGPGLWNGEAIGLQDPVAGLGGIPIIATVRLGPVALLGGSLSANGNGMTFNFGASAFTNEPPTGYTAGWPARVATDEWITAWNFPTGLPTNSAGWNGFTLRHIFPKGSINIPGTKVRATFTGGSAEGAQCDQTFIGFAAAAGDVYDFDGAQVQALFSGGASFDTGVNGSVVSDEITFANDANKAFIHSTHFNSAAKDTVSGIAATVNSGNLHYFKSANEAGTTDVATYSGGTANIRGLSKIEIFVP